LYAADKAASGEMSSVVSFRPPELKKGVQFHDIQNINQPQSKSYFKSQNLKNSLQNKIEF
jgi:hypothetical protein